MDDDGRWWYADGTEYAISWDDRALSSVSKKGVVEITPGYGEKKNGKKKKKLREKDETTGNGYIRE